MENKEQGIDNTAFQNEEINLQIIGKKNECKPESQKGDHVTVVTDGSVISNTASPTEDKTPNGHYPNGRIIQYGEDNDIILEKKKIDPKTQNCYERGLTIIQNAVIRFYETNEDNIWRAVGIIMLLAFLAYFGYAMYYSFGDEGSIRLLVGTIIGLCLLCFSRLHKRLEPLQAKWSDFFKNTKYEKARRIIRWVLYLVNVIVTVTLIIMVVALDAPENLLSLAGLAAFIVICVITSYSPAMINWHPVFWGFAIQFYFAIVILKTRWGYAIFNWLGDRITEFLTYSNAGASFVFGDKTTIFPENGPPIPIIGVYNLHFFAFSIMPVVTFFSTAIAIMYYLGIMQICTRVLGRFLAFCLATTPAESLNAAANIFASMTESPLVIRPYLPTMTSSELHAVMVGGFASIAGGVMGVYIGFGVRADHLLSASVMSAPAALAISKITYPEVEVPIVNNEEYGDEDVAEEGNVIEAACNGAIASAKIIASIIVNVIAFLSMLKFLNATLTWFGDRVGVSNLTFELICSYLLYPVALFMGTEPADCRQMAELVGIKTFTNEFLAYQKLSVLISNRKIYNEYVKQHGEGHIIKQGDNLLLEFQNNTILTGGIMSNRSEIIATYALCGFSNFGSMGILLGTLSAMAPNRKPTMAKLVLRAMIAGNVASFFTACIAGLFFEEFK